MCLSMFAFLYVKSHEPIKSNLNINKLLTLIVNDTEYKFFLFLLSKGASVIDTWHKKPLNNKHYNFP